MTQTVAPSRKRCSRSWAALLSRTYGYDVLSCPRCGGRMRVLSAICNRDSILRIRNHLGLDASLPATQPCRAPPVPFQEHLGFDDAPDVEALCSDPPWQDDVPVFRAD